MSTENEAQPAKSPKQATDNGVAAVFEDERKSLASFFDVLIQMDLELKQDNTQRIDDNARENQEQEKDTRHV